MAAVASGSAEARGLLQPLLVQATGRLDCAAELRVPDLGLTWTSPALLRVLAGAERVTVFAGTVGGAITDAARAAFSAGDYTRAVVLDACGTAAVRALSEQVRRQAEPGCSATAPYSPGYEDWDIADTAGILRALEARRIGLHLSAAHYLVPEKSFCGVVGWVRGGADVAYGCAICRLPGCRYRRREVTLV